MQFNWSQDCQKAFDSLKEKLASPPVLAYPKDEGEYILDTDASNHAIGAVLSQIQNGEERVISFVSRALCGGQQNYCTTKRELLAVVTFVEHFRYFLYGQHFTIRSDHASLKWLRNFKNIDGLLARWLATLEKYDYTIIHRKGPQHANADGLSRLPARKCPRNDCPQCTMKVYSVTARQQADETDECLRGWSNQDLFDWQREDPAMKKIIGWLETSSERPEGVTQYDGRTKAYLAQWEALFLNEHGILWRKWYPHGKGLTGMVVNQVVAPQQIRKRILESLHDNPTGAHLGRSKTINRVRYRFYWSGYKQDIIKWCRRCDICAQSKPGPKRRRGQLGRVPVAAPMERIAVDIMGPLPQTNDGNLYIMVVGDYFSKWTEAYPLKNHTAQTVADVLVEQFVARFGVMRSLHSDQGREFESDLIAELCKLLRIHKTRTVPYNPKSDGLVERANRTVVQMLTTLVGEARNDWDDHLPYVMMAYRASVHETTQFTLNRLMLNHETNLPIDLMVGASPETPTCLVHYVEWVKDAAEHAFEFVQRNLKVCAQRQKRLYDRKSGLPKFKIGDSVWRFSPPRARLEFGKPWEGPYLVTAKVNALCYRIQKSSTSRSIVVHVDHLTLYERNNPVESWLKSDVPREDSEDSGVELEVVTENQNASTGVTDQTSKKSGLTIPDNIIPQHSDFDATMPYETTSPSVPSADMDEKIPYGMDKQIMLGSYFDATMPYETTSPSVPSADMDETMPYGMDEQVIPNSDLNATMPCETTSPSVLSTGVDETIPCGMDEQAMLNSDLEATMPYEATPPLVLNTDLEETMPYGIEGQPELTNNFDGGSLIVDTPAAVSNTDMEETLPYTLSRQPSANTDFADNLPYCSTHQLSSPSALHVTLSDEQRLSNIGEENLKLSLDTEIPPEQITNNSVANPDVVKSNSVEQGATTSAPCETSKPITSNTPLSGMCKPVDDDTRPLAIRRTWRPLKPRIILDL